MNMSQKVRFLLRSIDSEFNENTTSPTYKTNQYSIDTDSINLTNDGNLLVVCSFNFRFISIWKIITAINWVNQMYAWIENENNCQKRQLKSPRLSARFKATSVFRWSNKEHLLKRDLRLKVDRRRYRPITSTG